MPGFKQPSLEYKKLTLELGYYYMYTLYIKFQVIRKITLKI